jgi:hypothetical protein
MAVSEPRGGAASTALCCCSLVLIILMAIALIVVYSQFITHTKFVAPPKVRKYAYVNPAGFMPFSSFPDHSRTGKV